MELPTSLNLTAFEEQFIENQQKAPLSQWTGLSQFRTLEHTVRMSLGIGDKTLPETKKWMSTTPLTKLSQDQALLSSIVKLRTRPRVSHAIIKAKDNS